MLSARGLALSRCLNPSAELQTLDSSVIRLQVLVSSETACAAMQVTAVYQVKPQGSSMASPHVPNPTLESHALD